MSVKLALSGRTFEINRNTISSIRQFREFAEFAARTGYRGVDLRKTQISLDTPPHEVKECARILADCGLEIVRMNPTGSHR